MRDFSKESWRLKLDRAEHHLKELEAASAPYTYQRLYPARAEVHDDRYPQVKRFFLRLPQPDSPWLKLIIGDILHNIRSSLDHLTVALSGRENDRDVAFPIYDEDIWLRAPDGTFVSNNNEARVRFTRALEGVDDYAVAVIKAVQPYIRKDPPPETHALRTLRLLENLDKHRKLIPFTWGLERIRIFYITPSRPSLRVVPDNGFGEDGAEILVPPDLRPDPEVQVYVEGTPVVTVGVGLPEDRVNNVVETIRTLIAHTRERLLPRLEPYIKL